MTDEEETQVLFKMYGISGYDNPIDVLPNVQDVK